MCCYCLLLLFCLQLLFGVFSNLQQNESLCERKEKVQIAPPPPKKEERILEVSGRTGLASGYQATVLEGIMMERCTGFGASRPMNSTKLYDLGKLLLPWSH